MSPGAIAVSRDEAAGFRAFLAIWVAQLVARIGNGLTAFGLAVHVYQQTGLSTSVAIVTAVAFLPSLLLAPIGGVLADRFDRRLLMILGDTCSALGLAAMLALFLTGTDTVALLCVCVAFSSICSSVMDPSYRATVSDLLTPRQYARAGGLVQLASASQYLVSPAIAGMLMATAGIETILVIDISTMLITVTAMLLVWRALRTRRPAAPAERPGFWAEFRFGAAFLARNRGVTALMLLITGVTFCMGFLQTLLTPMLLELTSEDVLGLVMSIAAVGMLVSALAIGVLNMGARHSRYLVVGLLVAAVAVMLLGSTTSILLIGAFAFVFFATLPPLNTSVEVLVRASIPNETQGRVWGLVGLISQLGYIVAYAVSGPLADWVFNPLLEHDGALAGSVGAVIGTGPARGIGLMLILVGALIAVMALVISRNRSVREMEAELIQQTTSAPAPIAEAEDARIPAGKDI